MTKSNWRNEVYLGEKIGGAGTLVRQGIKVGGKKGGRVVQKGTTAATAAGKSQVQKVKQGNQKKMVGSGKYEKLGANIGGLAGGAAGVLIPDGPAMVAGEIAGGIAGSKVGGKIGRQFDKRAEKKKLAQSEETKLTDKDICDEYSSVFNTIFEKKWSGNFELWYQVYKNNEYQEWHNHMPSTLSAIHFLNFKDEHFAPIFEDPLKSVKSII